MRNIATHPRLRRDYLSIVGEEELFLLALETDPARLSTTADTLVWWGHEVDGAPHLWSSTVRQAAPCPHCQPGDGEPVSLREASALRNGWVRPVFDLEQPGIDDDVDLTEALDWLAGVHAAAAAD